jgi:hypothetical protein
MAPAMMARRLPGLWGRLRRLRRDERGVWSVHNLFLTITCCAVGAAGVDVTHLRGARSQLQATADLAAHAALYTRRYGNPSGGVRFPLSDAVAAQRAAAAAGFGTPAGHGPVLAASNVTIGRWDPATRRVIPDAANPEAARVVTQRAGTNPVGTFLFRVVGLRSFDLRAAATFVVGPGECREDQGFFSQAEVEINSGNLFWPGFCIGAPRFRAQNGNTFRPGVTVMIPSPSGLTIPNSNPDTHNPGLMQALQYGTLDLAATLNMVRNDDSSLPEGHFYRSHPYVSWLLRQPNWNAIVPDPSVVTNRPISDPAVTLTPRDLPPNRAYSILCTRNNADLVLREDGSGNTFRNIVILTNCPVTLGGAVRLENVVLSTSNERRKAIQAPSRVVLGADDGCAPGGGAALISRGGFDVAARLSFHGALVRAGGVVDFQAGAFGEGVSVMAAGVVDTNSGIEMRACGPAAGALPTDVSLRLIQ